MGGWEPNGRVAASPVSSLISSVTQTLGPSLELATPDGLVDPQSPEAAEGGAALV